MYRVELRFGLQTFFSNVACPLTRGEKEAVSEHKLKNKNKIRLQEGYPLHS